jgi:phosphoglycerate dehydrogenase-like enzyme
MQELHKYRAISHKHKFVVENDSFLRLIQVVLDPAASQERFDAFAHFCKHDTPDFLGWCENIRAQAQNLYPTEVHLVDTQEQLITHASGATVIVVEELTIGAEELAAAGSTLRFVQKYGFTTRNIDEAACLRADVKVLTIRRRANISTAEQALMLMLALARQVTQNANLISVEQLTAAGYQPTTYQRKHTPNGNWARIPGMVTLYQRQLGIIGLGEIGRELTLRALALGMRIVYSQRSRLPEEVEQQYQATYCSLEELLASSDFVSLHLPRSPATAAFIGRRELSIIKPGAFLINVSQPNQVEPQALREALASGRLGGFGLDTFYEEPGDADDPLLQLPNVIITPHLGGSPRWNSLDDIEEVIVSLGKNLAS